ncbi:MAG TPA: OmpA family protein [Blastocatellia bacterium]|nr:OmpA family protein [Blastocatellia bacterium]
MKFIKSILAASAGMLMLTTISLAQNDPAIHRTRVVTDEITPVQRTTLAISYPNGHDSSVNIIGTSLAPSIDGKAKVERKAGRTNIKLTIDGLRNPQSLGSFYTTYVLWAIAPEGQADNLAEIPMRDKADVDVTTSFQTFGLIITAEPYATVKLPSPVIVAENTLRKGTEGGITSSKIEYRGDPGTLYAVSMPGYPAINADYNTPLLILGARRSVEIAKRAGARQYADGDLREAEVKLAALENIWPGDRKDERKYDAMAHDVMRLAEHARELSLDRAEAARLENERRAARNTIAQAQSDADRARSEAEQARAEADRYKAEMERAQQETELAKQRVAQAQTDAEREKANADLAKAEADQARLEAEQAKRDRDNAQMNLYKSISAILETRREARGLIVNLSDVLFDFDKATLKPGAREKLAKLTGILMAYPGPYKLQIEGYTDSVGTPDYNQKLSEARAQSVHDFLVQSGLTADRIIATRGFGMNNPVADNNTPEGRQMNRRVEIIISDTESPKATIQP